MHRMGARRSELFMPRCATPRRVCLGGPRRSGASALALGRGCSDSSVAPGRRAGSLGKLCDLGVNGLQSPRGHAKVVEMTRVARVAKEGVAAGGFRRPPHWPWPRSRAAGAAGFQPAASCHKIACESFGLRHGNGEDSGRVQPPAGRAVRGMGFYEICLHPAHARSLTRLGGRAIIAPRPQG